MTSRMLHAQYGPATDAVILVTDLAFTTVGEAFAEAHEQASTGVLRRLQLVLAFGGHREISSTLHHDELAVPANEWPLAANILDREGWQVHMHALAQAA